MDREFVEMGAELVSTDSRDVAKVVTILVIDGDGIWVILIRWLWIQVAHEVTDIFVNSRTEVNACNIVAFYRRIDAGVGAIRLFEWERTFVGHVQCLLNRLFVSGGLCLFFRFHELNEVSRFCEDFFIRLFLYRLFWLTTEDNVSNKDC